MTVVQNVASSPGGPHAERPVFITLIAGVNGAPGYTGSGTVVGIYATKTDDTGHWSLDLTPNSAFTPANTVYQVTEEGGVSLIDVPASGGPYNLSQLLVTPPPTPAAPGITGLQLAIGGIVKGVRPQLNLIAGTGVTLTAADNAAANRVDITVNAAGGGSGGGTVTSVNDIAPDLAGNVTLTAAEVGADAAGAAAIAQGAAIAAAEANAAGLYVPLSEAGTANGVATLDSSGHLTAAQAANLVASDWADALGLALLTAKPTEVGYTVAQPPGLMSCFLVPAAKTKTISRLGIWVTAAGVTASGYNGLAIYTEAGAIIDQTGDMSSQFAAANDAFIDALISLSRQVAAGSNFYLSVLTNFSGSQPHLAATGTTGTPNIPVCNGHYISLYSPGHAAFPTSFDPSTFSINSGNYVAYAR